MVKNSVILGVWVLGIIFIFGSLNCSSSSNSKESQTKVVKELSRSETKPMTEREFLVLKYKNSYYTGKNKQFGYDPPEAEQWLDTFYTSVSDSRIINDPLCKTLSAEEILELTSTQLKSKYLREKGYRLYSINSSRKEPINSYMDISNSDILGFGNCLKPVVKQGGHHWVAALAAMKPDLKFRTNIIVDNRANSQVKLIFDDLEHEYRKIYEEVKTKGKNANFETFNKKTPDNRLLYLLGGMYWEFRKESIILVTPKVSEAKYELNPNSKIVALGDEGANGCCRYFSKRKMYKMLDWELEDISVEPSCNDGEGVSSCTFYNFKSRDMVKIIYNRFDGQVKDYLKIRYKSELAGRSINNSKFVRVDPSSDYFLVAKEYDVFGYGKWAYLFKKIVKNNQEILVVMLSDSDNYLDLISKANVFIEKSH